MQAAVAADFDVADFDVAARLCLTDAPPLRAGDALHIALCQRLKAVWSVSIKPCAPPPPITG